MVEARDNLQAGGKAIPDKITSKWRPAKEQLIVETNQKCAYCESKFLTVGFGDVEHYRPKSIYWWLAYVYLNYLVSCSICNQKYKRDKFEFVGDEQTAPEILDGTSNADIKEMAKKIVPDPNNDISLKKYHELHKKEKPLILNPYLDDPEKLISWQAIPDLQEVILVPNADNAESEAIVDACDDIYGLNRKPLKKARYQILINYVAFREGRDAMPASRKPSWDALIKSMSKDDAEYAAMIRYFESNPAELPHF